MYTKPVKRSTRRAIEEYSDIKLAVCVLASARPNYLYVALDSLYKNRGISKYPLYIFCDGMEGMDTWEQIRYDIGQAATEFPFSMLYFAPHSLGIGEAHLQSLKTTFDDGYDYVLLIEDDIILRPDSIEYLIKIAKEIDGHLYSLYALPTDIGGRICFGSYNAWGTMFTRAAFNIISEAVARKEYLGLKWKSMGKLLGEEQAVFTQTHDGVFSAIASKYNLLRVKPDRCYTAHFGLVPASEIRLVDHKYIPMPTFPDYEPIVEFESVIYNKDRKEWLPSILDVLRKGDYVDEVGFRLLPKGYKYED